MNRKVYLALYKHKKPIKSWRDFVDRFLDELIRFITKSPYSHCELAVENDKGSYDCYSSSVQDKGVRCIVLRLLPERWDLIPLDIEHTKIENFYLHTIHYKYDMKGAFGVLFGFKQRKNRYFCSEWCWAAIGGDEGWRFSPAQLAAVAKFINNKED